MAGWGQEAWGSGIWGGQTSPPTPRTGAATLVGSSQVVATGTTNWNGAANLTSVGTTTVLTTVQSGGVVAGLITLTATGGSSATGQGNNSGGATLTSSGGATAVGRVAAPAEVLPDNNRIIRVADFPVSTIKATLERASV